MFRDSNDIVPVTRHHPIDRDVESRLRVDENELRLVLLRITAALVGSCKHCIMISTDIHDDAPIYCSKTNDMCYFRKVDAEECLDCGMFKPPA